MIYSVSFRFLHGTSGGSIPCPNENCNREIVKREKVILHKTGAFLVFGLRRIKSNATATRRHKIDCSISEPESALVSVLRALPKRLDLVATVEHVGKSTESAHYR